MQALAQQIAVAVEFPDWLMYEVAGRTWSVLGPAVTLFDSAIHTVLPGPMAVVDQYTAQRLHPMSQKMPLLVPSHVIFCIVAYLATLVVLYPISQAVGKLTLKKFANLHNLFLFLLSLYMWVAILATAVASGFTLWNNGVGSGDNGWRMAKVLWVFYVSKLPEFIDTVIMMMKQNYRQVSFLHLYHHSTIFIVWFLVFLEGPGGDAYFSGMLNSGVHVIMYGYYFGTSVFPTGPVRNVLNSIKFFITYGQMTQFSLNVCQAVYLLTMETKPNYARHLTQLLFGYMITLLVLFGNFLIRNKGASSKGASADKKKKQ